MMTKEGSTKVVNFMTPGAAVLVQGVAMCPIKIFFSSLGCGHTSHIVELIVIVLMDYDAAYLFDHLFYDWAVDIQI